MVKLNIINRIGSKLTDIKFFNHLLPTDVKIVVEPFAGGFAVIKAFYVDTNKYKFHINDKDETLYYVYKNYRSLIKICTELDDLYRKKYQFRSREFMEYVKKLNINKYIKDYILKTRFIRGGFYKNLKTSDYSETEANILNNALITNDDYKKVMNKYKDNKDAFIFVDPPYLFSDNSGYIPQDEETDMTDIIIFLTSFIVSCKCKIMIIINKLKLLEELFKPYIKDEYIRIYQLSKKESKHLIITNY